MLATILKNVTPKTLVGRHVRSSSSSVRCLDSCKAISGENDHTADSFGPMLDLPELSAPQSWPGLQPLIQFERPEALKHVPVADLHARSFSLFQLVPERTGNKQVQTKSRFDAIVLRDMCKCPMCRDPSSGQKSFATHDIPSDIAIRQFSVGKNGVRLEWVNDINGVSDHCSEISIEDLRKHSYGVSSTYGPNEIDHPMVAWRRNKMAEIFEKRDNQASYNELITDAKAFQRVLHHLWTSGLVFITEVPRTEQSVVRIAETIGPLRDSFYGRTWDVKDKPEAENVAYTSHYLGLHMDLLYMKRPPELQLLHCLDSSSVGGRSIFADAFQAAQDIFQKSPHYFDVLSRFPVTYNYDKGGHWYRDHKVVFEIDQNSVTHAQNTLPNRFANGIMPPLSNINWSPPFQGDFAIDYGSRDDATAFRLWCDAARAFDARLNAQENMFHHRLNPGECVIFHNRRVVHGREAFQSGSGARWLKGAYVDIDPFESKMRTVGRQYPSAGSVSCPEFYPLSRKLDSGRVVSERSSG